MAKDLQQVDRINGYYCWRDATGKKFWLPSVTTIGRACGDSGGLIRWNVGNGGQAAALDLLQQMERASRTIATDGILNTDTLFANYHHYLQRAKEKAIEGAESELARTGDFGTEAHAAIELYLKGVCTVGNEPEAMRGVIQTFSAFHQQVGFRPEVLEAVVLYAPDGEAHFGYGGRLDALVPFTQAMCDAIKPYLVRGQKAPTPGLYVTDVKTGSFYADKHRVQLAAYAAAWAKTHGIKIHGGMVWNIERENTERCKVYTFDHAALTAAFTQLRAHDFGTWKYHCAPDWFCDQWEAV